MNDSNRLAAITYILNFTPSHKLEDLRSFLRESGLSSFMLLFDRELTGNHSAYCLFTRKEMEEYFAATDVFHPSAKSIQQAFEGNGNPLHEKFFPEDDLYMNGQIGSTIIHSFWGVTIWLAEFIDKCIGGYIDILFLNNYFFFGDCWASLASSKNPLKPYVSIKRPWDENYDMEIKQKIMDTLIFPFILPGNGASLTKLSKCRNCGKYFVGKRLSAVFCSDKCRGAFHHANS